MKCGALFLKKGGFNVCTFIILLSYHPFIKKSVITNYKRMAQRSPFRGVLQQRKGTQNPKNISPNVPYEKCLFFFFFTMLPYRIQYNESEYTIQNNNFFYKTTKKTHKLY